MKKKAILSLLLAGCLAAMPCAVYGEAADTAETTETAAEAENADKLQAEAEEDGVAPSENLYDFQVGINGDLYQFPMSYEDFTALGWTLGKNDPPETMVASNSYGMVTFNRKEDSIMADMINLGINERPLSECLVGGISLEGGSFGLDLASSNVVLAKGITMGKSNGDDIQAAYGTPSDTYEGDLYVKYTYEQDSYQEIELYVYKDDNTLKEVSMRNFTEPEGYDKGSVSTETPEIVSAYTAPTALGEDLMDPVVEFCGDLYSVPCPVTALEANGWVMKDVAEDAYVAGRDIAFIEMMKDNQTVRFSIYNHTQNAVTLQNCFVEDLEAAKYDAETITLKLSGDIVLGAKRADLIKAAEEKGYLYEDEESYLNIYKTKDTRYDNQIEVWFDKNEDADSAASITYHNEILG